MLQFIFVCVNNYKAQTLLLNNCEGAYSVPQYPFGTGNTGVGSTGTNFIGTSLAFSYQNAPLSNPSANAKSGIRVLQINTNVANVNNSAFFSAPMFDLFRDCLNSPMTISFWMYRNGTDPNADRIRVLVNTWAGISGATLLTTVHRSRALSPIVYGMDGWYRYEAIIPPTYNIWGNILIFEAIDGSPGPFGNIFIDDIQYYSNGGWAALTNGGIADAGPDITICNGGQTQIGSAPTPSTTYAWLPSTGLSSSTIANPIASPAVTTNYTVTVTTTGAGCTTTKTDNVNVNISLLGSAPFITSASSTSICSGNTLAFPFTASNSPSGYLWMAADNASTSGESYLTTQNSATLNDLITSPPAQVVTYSVSAYNALCPAGTNPVQIFTVNVGLLPTISLSGTPIICSGGVGNISAVGTNISTYLWNTGATTANLTFVPAGLYTCTVTSVCGTTASASYSLNNPTPLNVIASGPTSICSGASVSNSLLGSGGNFPYTYNWTAQPNANITGESTVTQVSSTINDILINTSTSNESVIYNYSLTDGLGCVLTGLTTITVIPAFTYTANIADQPILTTVGRCASKQEILRLKIDMSTGTCPSTPTLTNIVFTAAGTEAAVSTAYIYYTGSNPNFTPTTVFSTIPSVVAGAISAAGSQTLTNGANYFWLVYDINPAGVGPNVDGTWTNFTFTGGSNPGTILVSSGNPAGARTISTCVSPGGIITGLTYWLKSNDASNLNSTTHNAPINNWSSSFSNISDLTQPNAAKQPLFKDYPHDTTFNFNPYLSFDGVNDILQNTFITDVLANDGLAMLVCAKSTTAASNNNTSLGFQKSAGNIAYQINPENTLRYKNSAGTASSFNVTGFTLPDADFIMAKMLSIAGNSSGTPGIADFMRNDNIFQGLVATAPVVETGLTIGGSGDGASFDRGNSKVAEVITYNRYLPQADLDKVETYAAIKYGIHLNKNYVSSSGTTIWNYAANTTYNHDIAGIGRDDKSGLNQKQTQSVNIDEMLTIALDSIEDSNKNNIATFANDNSFLVWGNNNHFPRSDYSTIIPIAAPYLPPGIQGRIKRVWKLQGTNFNTSGTFNKSGNPQDNQQNGTTATTNIQVAFDDYLLLNSSPVNNLFVLVDDDGVDFSNALVRGPGKSSTGATTSGARVVFEDVPVGPSQNFITLATSNIVQTLLPIQLINFKVMCDNNAANITWNTATENKVKDFTIEQSIDGINYSTVKIISPKGNATSGAYYSSICSIIPSKINYFRLKETAHSDITYCFDPVSIAGNCSDSNIEAFISPNPVSGSNGELTIRFSSEINSMSDLKVISNLGNVIYQTNYKSSETYNSLKLQINNLSIGIYFLEVKNNSGNYRFKFIVGD